MPMRCFTLFLVCLLSYVTLHAQQVNNADLQQVTKQPENIYTIRKLFLEKVLHNPSERNNEENDNDLEKFNRWFHFVEPRCYPSGDLPEPGALLHASEQERRSQNSAQKTTSSSSQWLPIGPVNTPAGYNGIGRVNCMVADPLDTNTLYAGAACGGLWISHNAGATWVSNSDNFPSLSIADIAVNPHHTDTIYAATGDGYGYPSFGSTGTIFWGGLYSAGVMKSTDGGSTWNTTGLTYLQLNNDIIQKLLIHPNNPDILLAANTHGISRSTDAGATWASVHSVHVFSMAFHPLQPDTIYAINSANLIVSYNAGATWSNLYTGINHSADRCTIGVSPASPKSIWVLNDSEHILVSHDEGHTFHYTTTPTPAYFYGYYDRVMALSPADSNFIYTAGTTMSNTTDGGTNWNTLDTGNSVHVDHHAVAFNPGHPATIYCGNDGGVFVSHNSGISWTNLSNGLMISQLYNISSSRQDPYKMLCGIQDNGTFYSNGTSWTETPISLGDGHFCGIFPGNDSIQMASIQYGNFYLSRDKANTFTQLSMSMSGTGAWGTPFLFNPRHVDTMYFGFRDVYATYDTGHTFVNLTGTTPFAGGAISMAMAPSNSGVLYAADYSKIMRTTDAGATWTNVTGNLPTGLPGMTGIAVDYSNPMLVYVTYSGYNTSKKVYVSTTGGTVWANITNNLPSIPVDCIALDSTMPGGIFAGTDIGVYYTDSTQTSWTTYNTGLPNVIVNALEINYGNHMLRAATFGRGVWETTLRRASLHTPMAQEPVAPLLQVYPNPTTDKWKLTFSKLPTTGYTVKLSDINGRVLFTQSNTPIVNAAALPCGPYNLELTIGDEHYTVKAIKK